MTEVLALVTVYQVCYEKDSKKKIYQLSQRPKDISLLTLKVHL